MKRTNSVMSQKASGQKPHSAPPIKAKKTSPEGKEAPTGEGNKSQSASQKNKSQSASEIRILKGMAMIGSTKSLRDLPNILSRGGIEGGWWDIKNTELVPLEVETKPPTKRSSRKTLSVFKRDLNDTERLVGVYRGPALTNTLASRRKAAVDYCGVLDFPDMIVGKSLNVYLDPNSPLFAELAFIIAKNQSSIMIKQDQVSNEEKEEVSLKGNQTQKKKIQNKRKKDWHYMQGPYTFTDRGTAGNIHVNIGVRIAPGRECDSMAKKCGFGAKKHRESKLASQQFYPTAIIALADNTNVVVQIQINCPDGIINITGPSTLEGRSAK